MHDGTYLLSLVRASEVICRLLGATSDFDFNGRDWVSLALLSWRLLLRLGSPLLWVLELLAGPDKGMGCVAVLFLVDGDKPLR